MLELSILQSNGEACAESLWSKSGTIHEEKCGSVEENQERTSKVT